MQCIECRKAIKKGDTYHAVNMPSFPRYVCSYYCMMKLMEALK